ncbi:MAG: hypothetical protein ACYC2H_03110 [Thermoplasmatota archaeon]
MDSGMATAPATASGMAAGPAVDATTEAHWAPGALAMIACTVLMVFFMFFSSVVASLLVPGRPAVGAAVAFIGLVASAVLSHVFYRRAHAALEADPALRGRWMVENSWWLVPVLGLALPLAGVAAAVQFMD